MSVDNHENGPIDQEALSRKTIYTDFNQTLKNPNNVYRLRVVNNGKISPLIKHLVNLQEIAFFGNDRDVRLKYLPDEFFELKNLTSLTIGATGIDSIPSGVEELQNLRSISFSGKLPAEIYKIESLQNVITNVLPIDTKLIKTTNIKKLNVCYLDPILIPFLGSLEELNVRSAYHGGCNELEISASLLKLKNLKNLNVWFTNLGNTELQNLMSILGKLPNLQTLSLNLRFTGGKIKAANYSVKVDSQHFSRLKNFYLWCNNLNLENHLYHEFSKVKSIRSINIRIPYKQIDFTTANNPLGRLKSLSIQLSEMNHLSDVRINFNRISYYPAIERIFDLLSELPHLEKLTIDDLDLSEYPTIAEINDEEAVWCNGVHKFPKSISKLKSLKSISINNVGYMNYESFYTLLGKMYHVESITINTGWGCENEPYKIEFDSIPSLKHIKKIQFIEIPSETINSTFFNTFSNLDTLIISDYNPFDFSNLANKNSSAKEIIIQHTPFRSRTPYSRYIELKKLLPKSRITLNNPLMIKSFYRRSRYNELIMVRPERPSDWINHKEKHTIFLPSLRNNRGTAITHWFPNGYKSYEMT